MPKRAMSERAKELLAEVLALPPTERDMLLDAADERAAIDDLWNDPDWVAELDRRMAAVADGTAVGIPWRESIRQLEASLAEFQATRKADR